MSIAAATIRMRPARGPALGKAPWPITAGVLSTLLHVALAVGLVLGARAWSQTPSKTYVVNLVPAVAAVGTPQGRPAPTPTLPPRVEETPRPAPPKPAELPQRPVVRETAPPEMPPREREPVALPERARSLPDRVLPPRPATTPRTGEKELPPMASTAPRPAPAPERVPGEIVARATPPPPAPLGRRDGSPSGSGPMTLDVADFPFAWYVRIVHGKISERWTGKAIPGAQPVAVFDIARDGRINGLVIEKSSGNSYYDQAALRAITEAGPFPALPPEYTGQILRVKLGFHFPSERG
jgi:protein TonB